MLTLLCRRGSFCSWKICGDIWCKLKWTKVILCCHWTWWWHCQVDYYWKITPLCCVSVYFVFWVNSIHGNIMLTFIPNGDAHFFTHFQFSFFIWQRADDGWAAWSPWRSWVDGRVGCTEDKRASWWGMPANTYSLQRYWCSICNIIRVYYKIEIYC